MVTVTIYVSDDLATTVIIITITLMMIGVVVSIGLRILSFVAVCEYLEVHHQHRFANLIWKFGFFVIFMILIQ